MATTATRLRRRVERREELLDAADRVVRRGAAGMSMDEVAAEAGITKPVLYRHFGDKDGLYEALARRYVDELERELERATRIDEPRARLGATIAAYLSYVEREPERYRFLLATGDRPATAHVLADFRQRDVARCAFAAAENLRRAGLDPKVGELWAHHVAGTIRAAGVWWLEDRSLSRERLAEYLTGLLWEGASALRQAGETA
jgi:AcrR family transcriptional regulator